jgi:hypothetical protein
MGHTADKVPDQALNKQTHQDNFCSVTKIDDQKLLEYAAMAQALKELSGWDGKEAQSKRIEILKNDVQGTMEFLGALVPQGDAFIRGAQGQLRHAEQELAGLQKMGAPPRMIEDQQARVARLSQDVERAKRSYEQNAKDYDESWAQVRAFFKSVYDQFMAEWNECGLLKALQITGSRLTYFVVEAVVVGAATFALGGVLFKATTFTFRIAKNGGRQIYRVRIKAPDDLSPEVVRKLDSRDVGGHEPRTVPDTPPPGKGKDADAKNGDKDKISKGQYDKLRSKTPSTAMQKAVNQGEPVATPQNPVPDKFLPGMYRTGPLHADHIVPMKDIVNMPGFSTLTEANQANVSNMNSNFVGLSESANKSKGVKSFAEWTEHKKSGTKVDKTQRKRMMQREKEEKEELKKLIEELNNAQNPSYRK